MPSKNMLPKGKRRHTVKPLYRATRGVLVEPTEPETQAHASSPGRESALSQTSHSSAAANAVNPQSAPPSSAREIPMLSIDPYAADAVHADHLVTVPAEADGMRLDQYLARAIPEISRSRVQLLIESGQVLLNAERPKGKDRIVPGDTIAIHGSPTPPPLAAQAEDIPLDVIYEDESLAVVNKPAGMSVHAGAASPKPDADDEDADTDETASVRDPRSSGTLVNALLHHFAGKLSGVGGELRPGIVHRLDKQTSGLLVVAKDDRTHTGLAEAFADRSVEKVYLALVHGDLRARTGSRTLSHPDEITVDLPIGRDLARRTRMTTRRPADGTGVRSAVSHLRVLERLETSYGVFSLVEVRIETGRTHQIRVHLQALGHPVVGDTVYGAPALLQPLPASAPTGVWRSKAARPAPPRLPGETLKLERNFLHAARLSLTHPRTGEPLTATAPLPPELADLLSRLGSQLGPTLGPAPLSPAPHLPPAAAATPGTPAPSAKAARAGAKRAAPVAGLLPATKSASAIRTAPAAKPRKAVAKRTSPGTRTAHKPAAPEKS